MQTRSRISALLTFSCILPALLATPALTQDKLMAVSNEEGVTILEGIRPVLTYQQDVKSSDGRWPRNNYVHPLYDLNGNVITEDFPADHGHHRGIFWAWHQVRLNGKNLGDAWLCEDFQWQVQKVLPEQEGRTAVIKTEVVWKSPVHTNAQGTPISLVREHAEIRTHPRTEHSRAIDFTIQLWALVDDIAIGGSEDAKGYGGFSPRIALRDEFVFSGPDGEIEPQIEAIKAGPWVNIGQKNFGFAMIGHKQNPDHPQPWILRRKRSMQNPVFPGREPVQLSKTTPLTLRYRVVIHDGTLEADSLNELYQEFIAD